MTQTFKTKEDILLYLKRMNDDFAKFIFALDIANNDNIFGQHYIGVLKSALHDYFAIYILLENNFQIQAIGLMRNTLEKVIILMAQEYIYTNCKNSDPLKHGEINAASTEDVKILLSNNDKDKKEFSYNKNGDMTKWRSELFKKQELIQEEGMFKEVLKLGNNIYTELCDFAHPEVAIKNATLIQYPQWIHWDYIIHIIIGFSHISHLAELFAMRLLKNICNDCYLDELKKATIHYNKI